MKILYTYLGLTQRIGGVSRYFYENVIRIEKVCKVNVCMAFLSNEYFRRKVHRIWFEPKNKWTNYLRLIIEECFLWANLKFSKYDVVHLTSELLLSAFRWTRKPIVITIHDMIPELIMSSPKVVNRRKYAIYHASHIICVSKNTQNDLLRLYPDIPMERTTVIYHGHSSIKYEYNRLIQDRYLLFVGARTKEYKNFDTVLKSLASIMINNGVKLVCTGTAFDNYEKTLIQELNIEKYVVNVGYVDNNELASLYHFAACFIYPSLYEGFGIPILEAWAHKCPVCVSDASCFPEIGGDAVAYFDPNDSESIRLSVERILCDANMANGLVTRGEKRLESFSWERAAQSHIEVYRKVMGM